MALWNHAFLVCHVFTQRSFVCIVLDLFLTCNSDEGVSVVTQEFVELQTVVEEKEDDSQGSNNTIEVKKHK